MYVCRAICVMFFLSVAVNPAVCSEYPNIPVLRCTDFTRPYHPTTLANGVIGISPGKNPLLPCQTVVSGFVRSHPSMQFEEFSRAPYPLGTDIQVNNVSMREHPDKITVMEQTLYMEYGELVTKMVFRPSDNVTVDLEVLQFASRSVPALVCQQIAVRASQDVTVQLTTHVDREGLSLTEYAQRNRAITGGWYTFDLIDQVKAYQSDRCRLGIALAVLRNPGLAQQAVGHYKITVVAGQIYYMHTIGAMVPEFYHFEPHLEAIRLVRWGEMLGFERLQMQNRSAWSKIWNSRVRVTGCKPEDQRAIDVAFYYLNSNVHPSMKTGTPPFGLTQSDAYYGHNFWDTDIWMMLPTVVIQPGAAKAAVEYRHRGLQAAQDRARLFGYRGAQYPWEAAPINGAETTPSSCPTGWAEQHTTPGVAIGVWEYQMATGDPTFLREYVWPIMKNIAEWIVSRGEFTKRGFEFSMMMGPDEHVNDLSNQTYFNLLSKMAINAAMACAKQMDLPVPEQWQRVAESIYIPMDEEKKIVLPYDPDSLVTVFDESTSMFVKRPSSLDDASYSLGNLHFVWVHGCPVSEEVFNNTYLHEEKIRLRRPPAPSVPGSSRAPSFTSPVYMACAAFCGEREKSAALFENSWKPYWLEPFGMIREYQSQSHGSYITAFGGMLKSVMFTLTGLRISEGDWRKYPARLPAGWEKIEIDRIWIRGKAYKVIAEHGKKAELIPQAIEAEQRPTHIPQINVSAVKSVEPVKVTITADAGAQIRYTTNGRYPDETSTLYQGPFMMKQSGVISARAFKEGYQPSMRASEAVTVVKAEQ
jgi:trehalose/maltose hydrolase-like predicted phosphorylase